MRHRLFEKANIDRTGEVDVEIASQSFEREAGNNTSISRVICKAKGLYRPVTSMKSLNGYVAVATVSAPINDRGTTPVNVMWSYCEEDTASARTDALDFHHIIGPYLSNCIVSETLCQDIVDSMQV